MTDEPLCGIYHPGGRPCILPRDDGHIYHNTAEPFAISWPASDLARPESTDPDAGSGPSVEWFKVELDACREQIATLRSVEADLRAEVNALRDDTPDVFIEWLPGDGLNQVPHCVVRRGGVVVFDGFGRTIGTPSPPDWLAPEGITPSESLRQAMTNQFPLCSPDPVEGSKQQATETGADVFMNVVDKADDVLWRMADDTIDEAVALMLCRDALDRLYRYQFKRVDGQLWVRRKVEVPLHRRDDGSWSDGAAPGSLVDYTRRILDWAHGYGR